MPEYEYTKCLLLGFIAMMLLLIWIYLRWIYLKLEYGSIYDPDRPVNRYGENLTDAIQMSFVRGQRGVSLYD